MQKKDRNKYKKQLQKIEKEVGMEYQKENGQGCTDGNKGQGSSLLLLHKELYNFLTHSICRLHNMRSCWNGEHSNRSTI